MNNHAIAGFCFVMGFVFTVLSTATQTTEIYAWIMFILGAIFILR